MSNAATGPRLRGGDGILILLIIVAFFLITSLAHSQNAATPTAVRLSEQQDALRTARQQAAEAKRRSERLEAQASAAEASADTIRRQILAVAARIQEAEANIAASRARIAIIAGQQREQRARLAEQQQPTARLTAALQHLARRPAALAILQPGSIKDMVHVRGVMATVLPQVEARTSGLRAEVERGKQLRAQADQAAKLLRDDRANLATRRQALARLETERRLEFRKLANNSGAESERALAYGEEARDITDLMVRIQEDGSVRRELAELDGPLLRPAAPGQAQTRATERTASTTRRPAYRLPVIGEVVTGLGEISEGGVRARGLTIATQADAQVIAPANGRIAYAGPYRGYGEIVIIEHAGGWTTLIISLAATTAEVGDTVVQGEPIGRAGPTRPTITVELRRNGRPVDIAALVAS